MEMDKLLLEYPWLPKVVSHSKEYGLDWLLMASIALSVSNGDPRFRTIDNDFLFDELNTDNPHVAMHWDKVQRIVHEETEDNPAEIATIDLPQINVIDLATRWGLFQILGRVARDNQAFSGRMINFTDIGANVRAACILASRAFAKNESADDVILYFDANPAHVYELMEQLRISTTRLLTLSADTEEEDE